jgi:hypothetical protein
LRAKRNRGNSHKRLIVVVGPREIEAQMAGLNFLWIFRVEECYQS